MTSIRFIYIVVVFTFVFTSCKVKKELPSGATPVSQISLARVDKMPFHPKPYKYRDWKKTAIDFDNYIFDFDQKGKNLPFVWLDGMKRNFPDTTFGIYTALGDIRMGAAVNNGENHEALGALGAVLGATMIGIDKSDQEGRKEGIFSVCCAIILLKTMDGMSSKISPIKEHISVVDTVMIFGMKYITMCCFMP